LLALSWCATAQSISTITEIDRYAASLQRLSKSSKNIVVADTSDEYGKGGGWKRFASERALEKFRQERETYSIAFNWKKSGKLVVTNFTDFSPSGDWALYSYHTFRPNGTIAKVEVELRTFHGNYIMISDYYFDPHGKQIKKISKCLDLTTKKPKELTKEMLDNNSGAEVHFYKTVTRLPFARLIAVR
jgi:hypothetical protein